MSELKIIECDNGYVITYEDLDAEDRVKTNYIPIEDSGDPKDCLSRMLLRVAEHFGFQYDKFSAENIEITFTKKGHKME